MVLNFEASGNPQKSEILFSVFRFRFLVLVWDLKADPYRTQPNLIYQNYNKESNQDLAEVSCFPFPFPLVPYAHLLYSPD